MRRFIRWRKSKHPMVTPSAQKTIRTLRWNGAKQKHLFLRIPKKPTLIITKTNALTNQGVPDTVFKIQRKKADGGVVTLGTYKTDANGQIVLKGVDAGWYVITEVRAAQGMSLPSNPVTRKYLAEGEMRIRI